LNENVFVPTIAFEKMIAEDYQNIDIHGYTRTRGSELGPKKTK